MKEVKKALEEREILLEKAENQFIFSEDEIRLKKGGEGMEKAKKIFSRKVLYDEIWENALTNVAKKYGIPGNKLKAACIKANIPLPTNSYWGNVQTGNPVQKPELPLSESDDVLVEFSFRTEKKQSSEICDKAPSISGPENKNEVEDKIIKEESESELSNPKIIAIREKLNFLPEDERNKVAETAVKMSVYSNNKKLHHVLKKHRERFTAWKKQHPRDEYADWHRDKYRASYAEEPPLWESVSEKTLPRVYQILNPLFYAIEELGGYINSDLSVRIRCEKIYFEIIEGKDKTAHVLTKSELSDLEKYERAKAHGGYALKPNFRKYDYIANGKLRVSIFSGTAIKDSAASRIEDYLDEILVMLYIKSENLRIEREKAEEKKRKAEEQARQKELYLQKYNREVDKFNALKNEADDFETACKIRTYISAIENRTDIDEATLAWVAWAKEKADWIDPTVNAEDPFFGKRKHSANSEDKNPKKKGYW